MSHRQTLKVASAQYPIDQPATLDAWRDKIARWVSDGAEIGTAREARIPLDGISSSPMVGAASSGGAGVAPLVEKAGDKAGDSMGREILSRWASRR